jgi:fructokinase
VIGEALIDLITRAAPQTWTALPGGSPYNVAIGLARLEVKTSLMARLSDSAFGRSLREHAAGERVDLSAAITASEPATLAVVTLDEHAGVSYDFYVNGTADWQWSEQELAEMPADTAILHFGSLASWTEPGAGRICGFVASARREGGPLVSYDPNVRPLLQRDRALARRRVERCIAVSDLIKASAEDIAWLYPDLSGESVAALWLGLGALVVVITDGARGARAHTRTGGLITRPAPAVDVVDTVGSGDAFTSGMLASLLRHGTVTCERLAGLEQHELGAVLDDAILTSALTCEREGSDPPTLAEQRRRSAQLPVAEPAAGG